MPSSIRTAFRPSRAAVLAGVCLALVVPPALAEVVAPERGVGATDPASGPATDPAVDWYGPARFQTPTLVTPEPEPVSPIPIIDAPDTAPVTLWSPDPSDSGGLTPPQDERMAFFFRTARFGHPIRSQDVTLAAAGFSATDPAEGAYLMSRFRSLPAPGVPAAFAIGAIGLCVRRRAVPRPRHTMTGASTHTQFKDPLC